MPLHHRDVHAVASGQQSPILNNLPGPQNIILLYREDIIHNVQKQLECRPNGFPLAYGGIPMQDLLKHFGVGYETLSRRDQAFQEKLRFGLVRVRRTDEVHRDIGIDKDQA